MKLASFEAIVRVLDEAAVRYLVADGLAVNAHGYLSKDYGSGWTARSADSRNETPPVLQYGPALAMEAQWRSTATTGRDWQATDWPARDGGEITPP